MSDHHNHGHDGHAEHDHGPVFFQVFIGLLILTAMSVAVGTFLMGRINPLVAWSMMMAISCMKALLVISFFMHLRWEANWKYVLTIPASIMSIFLVLMLVPDVLQRSQTAAEERQGLQAVVEAPVAHGAEGDHDESGRGLQRVIGGVEQVGLGLGGPS